MTAAKSTLRRTWLVQRLEAPSRGFGAFGKDSPFSFGGGLRNGGLSDEAMGLLRGIFSFDYMGAAEFEFGAVPKALNVIAGHAGRLAAFTVEIPLADVPKNWQDKSTGTPTGSATIYALAPVDWKDEVTDRINEWARVEYPELKEGLRLTSTLRPVRKWDGNVTGWLEIDNGFFFFADRDMWAKTCDLFGVEVSR